ncbi:hypothetical protein PGT21_031359 [Puccinia graminis f. sp. tritici]|uniref:Uncharacterized protein n=1 Tax=Puccinia graminis f. sp. tritici TaxID=56615 RepID=A0A5B0PVG6_PUCGR|nr:hypothetical protein PGT21_031359 [Puccinia graminis f. sp. tritici]
MFDGVGTEAGKEAKAEKRKQELKRIGAGYKKDSETGKMIIDEEELSQNKSTKNGNDESKSISTAGGKSGVVKAGFTTRFPDIPPEFSHVQQRKVVNLHERFTPGAIHQPRVCSVTFPQTELPFFKIISR